MVAGSERVVLRVQEGQHTLALVARPLEQARIQVITKIAPDLPEGPVPEQIVEVLLNLIINAIKYTPNHGQISIRSHAEDGQVIIQVQDNGSGILPAEQPFVFDKFYRGSNIPYDSPGSGLGLAIVQSIVQNHLGRIWLESTPGQGTTFTVVLPV